MIHPLLRKDIFVETAFEKRFQAMLRSAWYKRSWHVSVADPGAGKTMGIRDLLKTAGGRSVLAVVAPKNNEDEQAVGDQLYTALGLPLRGHWRTRKPRLMGHLHQYGTECLIVDDAHDLSLEHLMLLKEVTDQGRLQYDHPLGLCLVAAGRGDTIPLKETLDLPDPTWLQFRRRFDKAEFPPDRLGLFVCVWAEITDRDQFFDYSVHYRWTVEYDGGVVLVPGSQPSQVVLRGGPGPHAMALMAWPADEHARHTWYVGSRYRPYREQRHRSSRTTNVSVRALSLGRT